MVSPAEVCSAVWQLLVHFFIWAAHLLEPHISPPRLTPVHSLLFCFQGSSLALFSPMPSFPVGSFSAQADPVPPLLKALLWLPLPFIYSPNCTQDPSGSAADYSGPLRPLPVLHLNF